MGTSRSKRQAFSAASNVFFSGPRSSQSAVSQEGIDGVSAPTSYLAGPSQRASHTPKLTLRRSATRSTYLSLFLSCVSSNRSSQGTADSFKATCLDSAGIRTMSGLGVVDTLRSGSFVPPLLGQR